MALRVRIEHGQDAGKTFRLPVPGAYRFGRNPAGSVQILDMKVSKEHFEIAITNGGSSSTIRDLGSSHGTLLNAQKVPTDAREVTPGDEIRVGLTVLRVLSDGPADVEVKATGPAPTPAPASATGSTSVATAVSTPAPAGAPKPAPGGNGGGKPAAAAAGKKALPPDDLVGRTLGGYKILEKVGAGGMGAVYRAEQLSLHREVALKVLADKLVSDSAFVDQFVNEARAAGQLNHPNVVQVYDVGQAEGRHFFSMEFIHGGPLESRIPKLGGGVKWQDALPWFLDAANALIFAEKKGILHRDIKPDNFMLSQDGSVKLCDLGLAKKSESNDLLAQGIIGTPHFISPEAIRRKTDVDGRADLYSLGCTFYRLLTGKNPYPAPSVKEILLAHLNAPVPRVSATVSGAPKELDEVVFRLMQKDAAARFENAEALWKTLDKIRLQFGLEAHGLHPGRAKKVAIFAGIVGVAAIGVAVYLVTRPKEKETVYKPGETVVVGDPEADAKLRESKAREHLLEIERDAYKIGDLDATWSDKAWEGIVDRYERLAKDEGVKGTVAAGQADQRAGQIRADRERLAKSDADFRSAQTTAKSALDAHQKKAVEDVDRLKGEGRLIDADEAGRKALVALDEFRARELRGKPLLEAAAVDGTKDAIEKARKELVDAVQSEYEKLAGDAKSRVDKGSTEALDAAIRDFKAWKDKYPERPAKDSPLAARLVELHRAADRMIETYDGRRKAAAELSVRNDRRAWFDLVKALFSPEVGDLSKFQIADALVKVRTLRHKVQSKPYQLLLEGTLRDVGLVAAFFEEFPKAFAAAPYKDKIVGTGGGGWSGVPKKITAEGVVTSDDKVHPFAEEGVTFFLDLFYDRGKERIPLTADGHEALATIAAAGIVTEADTAGHLDRAKAEWEKAVAHDPARAAIRDDRLARAEKEEGARAAWNESAEAIGKANEMMEKFEADIMVADVKANTENRTKAVAAQPEIAALLGKARQRLQDLGEKFVSTLFFGVRLDEMPAKAAWAGETPPAEKARPGERPPGGTNGSGMDEGAAMDDGAGMDGAAMGDAEGPGASPPGMDAKKEGEGDGSSGGTPK